MRKTAHITNRPGYRVLEVAGTISFAGSVGSTGASTELFGNGAFTGASTGGAGAGSGARTGGGTATPAAAGFNGSASGG